MTHDRDDALLPDGDRSVATPEELADEITEEGRARIRENLAAMRARSDRHEKGLVIVNTGNGKGKTTAALGVLMRAWGRDMRVIMLQFIKHKTANWGESRAAKKMGVEIVPLGGGFTWTSNDLDHDRQLAQEGWQRCRKAIESGEYDVVILDEITYCLKYGWLSLEEVLSVLSRRPPTQHVVITGRDAPAELIEFADLVTEMREIKHPFKEGVKALPIISDLTVYWSLPATDWRMIHEVSRRTPPRCDRANQTSRQGDNASGR